MCVLNDFVSAILASLGVFFALAVPFLNNIIKSISRKTATPFFMVLISLLLCAYFSASGLAIASNYIGFNPFQSKHIDEDKTPNDNKHNIENSENKIEDNTDIVSPYSTISQLSESNQKNIFIPENELKILFNILDYDIDIQEDLTISNRKLITNNLYDIIKQNISSNCQEDSKIINGTPEFTNRTEEANDLEKYIINNGIDIYKLKQIINLREEAYGLFQTQNLCKLLANNYHQLARYYARNEQFQSAFDSYITSICYELEYIKFCSQISDDYYIHLYNIAVLYQAIGDIQNIDINYKQTSFFISMCLYDITAMNKFTEQHFDYNFLSNYYAGIINHKLAIISWYYNNQFNTDTKFFLEIAFNYYQTSLQYKYQGEFSSYPHEYMSQIYEMSTYYINRYGQPENLESIVNYYK